MMTRGTGPRPAEGDDGPGPVRAARVRGTRRQRLRRWLTDDDAGRMTLASVVTVVIPVVLVPAAMVLGLADGFSDELPDAVYSAVLTFALYWISYTVFYSWLTLRRFRGRSPGQLAHDLRHRSRGLDELPRERRRWQWNLLGAGTTVENSTVFSLMAFTLVAVVLLTPQLNAEIIFRLLGLGMVVGSWGLLVITQALAYARLGAQHGVVEFSGDGQPVFDDYLALAVFVSAMFGTGDARLHGKRARRILRDHVLVSFLFNSMVIATLATLLLAG